MLAIYNKKPETCNKMDILQLWPQSAAHTVTNVTVLWWKS